MGVLLCCCFFFSKELFRGYYFVPCKQDPDLCETWQKAYFRTVTDATTFQGDIILLQFPDKKFGCKNVHRAFTV